MYKRHLHQIRNRYSGEESIREEKTLILYKVQGESMPQIVTETIPFIKRQRLPTEMLNKTEKKV